MVGENMKNGFTLIELLGVITLLAVISLIAVPTINNSLTKSRENLKVTQEKQVIKAAKDFFSQNLNCLPGNSGCSYLDNGVIDDGSGRIVYVSKLEELGYISSDSVINPVNNKKYSEFSGVKVIKDNEEFKYEFIEE